MSLAFQSSDSIKQALFEELQNILSADKSTRTGGEENVKKLEFTEGYGVFLAEFTMNQSFDLALRQLASVMLTRYVEEHWANDESVSTSVVATNQAKDMIRKILPNGLYDSHSKIRAAVAYNISTIAAIDWPHTWTDLFDIIVKCLGGNEDSIHGAMQVLIEFPYDSKSRIPMIGPIILQEVYRIFEAEQVYKVETRTCAVTIFKSLLKAINAQMSTKDKAKLLDPVLPVFISKLVDCLSSPSGQHTTFELKTEIIKVLAFMVADMPKLFYQYNAQILPPVWQLLTQTAEIYVKAVVNANDVDIQDDDEMSNFSTLIIQMFEFIHSIVERTKFKSIVQSVLVDLVYISVLFIEITQEQITDWEDDIESYIEDLNSVESVRETIRMCSSDLLMVISDEFSPEIILPAIAEAFNRHVHVAEFERANNPNWWKIVEASVKAIGLLPKHYVDANQETRAKFNIREYLAYTKTTLGQGGNGAGYQGDISPYLHGTLLLTLCRYVNTDIYDRPTLQAILDCVANDLNGAKPMIIQICAMRCFLEIGEELKNASEEQRRMVVDKFPGFLNFITDFATRANGNILSELLSTIATVIGFDVNFTSTNHSRVISFSTAIFLKYSADPFILEQVQDIIIALAANKFCIGALQERLVPTLLSILNLDNNDDVEKKHLMQDTAMEILRSIVNHSPVPLSAILVNNAFPTTVKCILRTEDHAIMQSGGECLRSFINASPEQICLYNNGEGLNYIMEVVTLLLNPMSSEFTATFVGRLVITIVSKAGNYLGEHIQLLLKAVISKMQLVEALGVMMSLVVTFAHLIITQMDAVLNFLTTVPGPSGEPAIKFVLSTWLSRQHMFYGTYERKITVMALCKLFEYGVTTQDARLVSITIRSLADVNSGPENSNKPRTRQQTGNQDQWIDVPVLVKIFKILINELGNLNESILFDDEEELSEDESSPEDGTDGTENGSIGGSPKKVLLTSDLFDGEETEEEDDQLLKELEQDPIFKSSLNENLTKFLQNFIKAEQFGEFAMHLSDHEKTILSGIQI